GSVWMSKLREGAAEVKKLTNGRVRFKFYPGGVMGDNNAVMRKIRIGQLHGGALTGGSLTRFYKDNLVYSLVMKYRTAEEIKYVRQNLDATVQQGLKKGGFTTFGFAESGFSYVMSSKTPVASVKQLRKQKAWIPAHDEVALEAVSTFGVSPIPLPLGDVLTGLQTGLIDTIAASPIGALALQWYTQIKYLTELPILYSYGALAISNKAFNKAKPEDQKIVASVMTRVFKELDDINKKDNKEALAVLKTQGVKFIKPSAEQIKEWMLYAKKSQQRLLDSGRISQGIVAKADKLLRKFHTQ
ncbi:TRAP transporter substrate-binding protein DctP, partial [Beggiatoa alba]|nr:TRAP transporter substrate-binding protein DctP [Beggiatoa alba]